MILQVLYRVLVLFYFVLELPDLTLEIGDLVLELVVLLLAFEQLVLSLLVLLFQFVEVVLDLLELLELLPLDHALVLKPLQFFARIDIGASTIFWRVQVLLSLLGGVVVQRTSRLVLFGGHSFVQPGFLV